MGAGGALQGVVFVHQAFLDEVREVLKTVEDPELRMSIVDLGLLYGVTVEDDGLVAVDLTLTSPA